MSSIEKFNTNCAKAQGSSSSVAPCDTCTAKGGHTQPAIAYCGTCSKKYCPKHQEFHDELHKDHPTEKVKELTEIKGAFEQKTETKEVLESRPCGVHKGEFYLFGCPVCKQVFCYSCIDSTNLCITGQVHALMKLAELKLAMETSLLKKCEKVMAKEEMLGELCKRVVKASTEYQQETANMLQSLQKIRDEQIEEITMKYKMLEEELAKSRLSVQSQFEPYLGEKLSCVLNILRSQRQKIMENFKTGHPVDLSQEFDGLLFKLNDLSEIQVDNFIIPQSAGLVASLEKKRDLEVQLVPAGALKIDDQRNTTDNLPTSLSTTRPFDLHSFCHSMCHVNGFIFAATHNQSIEMIDGHANVNLFAAPIRKARPYGIVHSDGLLVVLSSGDNIQNCTIDIYYLNGQLASSWIRTDNCHYIRPAVVQNQIVVPDPSKNQLTVYSMKGVVTKQITGLPLTSGATSTGVAACAVDDNAVVVTCRSTSFVIKIRIETGETIWACQEVSLPNGVAVYNKEHVCVVSAGKLSMIDTETGCLIKVFHGPKLRAADGHKMDVEVFGTKLVVSAENRSLIFHNLIF